MNGFKIQVSPSALRIVALFALLLWGPFPSQAQELAPTARHIQAYYQQLLPTLQQAGAPSFPISDPTTVDSPDMLLPLW